MHQRAPLADALGDIGGDLLQFDDVDRHARSLHGGEELTHPVQVDPELLGHDAEYSGSPALTRRAAALRWNAC